MLIASALLMAGYAWGCRMWWRTMLLMRSSWLSELLSQRNDGRSTLVRQAVGSGTSIDAWVATWKWFDTTSTSMRGLELQADL
jgi:hypothetical protein